MDNETLDSLKGDGKTLFHNVDRGTPCWVHDFHGNWYAYSFQQWSHDCKSAIVVSIHGQADLVDHRALFFGNEKPQAQLVRPQF
jgi:hypothetical protein